MSTKGNNSNFIMYRAVDQAPYSHVQGEGYMVDSAES